MIQVEVSNTFLINMGREFIILLHGIGDPRVLPIGIGQMEAQSIAIMLNKVPFPRPLTHDLLKNIMERLNCKVIRTEISDLINETFYAKLFLSHNGEEMEIDSRPSDAIAVSLRFNAPIFVHKKVMDEAGIIIPKESEAERSSFVQDEPARELTPLEVLQKQLQQAIDEERYEDAARIRDEIKKMNKSN
jgi:bifunctional DNase/RNase